MSTSLVTGAGAGISVSTPRKRNHEGEVIARQSAIAAEDLAGSVPTGSPRQKTSPAPSHVTSELTDLASIEMTSPSAAKAVKASDVSVKKSKLTFAEKEAERLLKQQEKEEKARQKADEKARKEEEKRQRDEEKRKREEEKEVSKRMKELEKAEKQKIRDAEKQEKDAEKAKKDAEKREKELEKLKKEKSQLRIGSFFGRPAPQSTPPTTPPDDVPSAVSSRRSSVAASDGDHLVRNAESKADFEKYIIPYFVHDNTELAPFNRFEGAHKEFFGGKQSSYVLGVEDSQIEPLRLRFGRPRKRMRMTDSVKEIVERIQSSQINTVDLADEYNPLASVPYKILAFREDIRPPYMGTYSKHLALDVARKMSRRPLHRGRTDTNYDYDSEAEWEEPAADDEELLDDEMSESEDGDDDMQDFLDDEDDQGKRRMFASEMQPVSSGLCFEGEDFDSNGYNLAEYRMDLLHDSTTFPIDPYSTKHWTDIGKSTPARGASKSGVEAPDTEKHVPGSRSMPPPRMPLATVNPPNILNKYLSTANSVTSLQKDHVQNMSKGRSRQANPNREVRMIQAEFMNDFKQAIDGSDLTKAGLIEILKKQFPKCSKDAIKDTLGAVAVRVGKKEAEKKWALI